MGDVLELGVVRLGQNEPQELDDRVQVRLIAVTVPRHVAFDGAQGLSRMQHKIDAFLC